MDLLNAKTYYTRMFELAPRDYCVVAVHKRLELIIDTFTDGEPGIRRLIQWLAACPFPEELGLCDSSAFDTFVAQFITMYQNVLAHFKYDPEPLPENAPKAATPVVISQGRGFQVTTFEGGSNRAQAEDYAKRRALKKEQMKLDCTEACKAALAEKFKDDPIKGKAAKWKRIKILKDSESVCRVFKCADGTLMSVIFNQYKDEPLTFIDGNLFPDFDPKLLAPLKKAAATIKHCGDYGTLHFSPSTYAVNWCAGDADGEDPCTSIDEIKRILSVPGISSVEVEAEWAPSFDAGFIDLGKFGEEVPLW